MNVLEDEFFISFSFLDLHCSKDIKLKYLDYRKQQWNVRKNRPDFDKINFKNCNEAFERVIFKKFFRQLIKDKPNHQNAN